MSGWEKAVCLQGCVVPGIWPRKQTGNLRILTFGGQSPEAQLSLRQAGFGRTLIGKFTPTDAELGELAADSTNSALGSCAQRPWHFFTLCF